MNYPASVFLFD